MKQNELKKIAILCSKKIEDASKESYFLEPYKHLIIDDFFPKEIAESCMNAFPDLNDYEIWEKTNDIDIEIKYRTKWKSEFDIPDEISIVTRIMNSADFLLSISKVFDIHKLVPDTYFTGGGLNVTESGGLLDVHVDGNYHDATGLNRRLNAILYLNPNWKNGWGGEFGIYDNKGEELIKSIEPIFNRLVVFDTHDLSFHGLPNPLNFPVNENRKSVILYYYTKESRPGNQIEIEQPHSALWKKRGWVDKRGNKTRDHK